MRVTHDHRGRIVRCDEEPGGASIVRVRGPRNLDGCRARSGQHIDGRRDRLVYLALAHDATFARAHGREQRAENDDERGESPRASEAAEDHLQKYNEVSRASVQCFGGTPAHTNACVVPWRESSLAVVLKNESVLREPSFSVSGIRSRDSCFIRNLGSTALVEAR